MNPWLRNQRLYETLKGMGLFVTAVPFEDEPDKINWIQVSAYSPAENFADLIDRMIPSSSDGLVPRNVGSPMQGAQVADMVAPTLSDGENVIDFPPER